MRRNTTCQKTLPELRKDPVTGRWVIISTRRRKRPNDFRIERSTALGGSYCPFDGHVNSLRLFRTLHTAINARGVTYLSSHRVEMKVPVVSATPPGDPVP